MCSSTGKQVNCLEVFPTPFNSINSLLIITLNFTPIHVYPRLNLLDRQNKITPLMYTFVLQVFPRDLELFHSYSILYIFFSKCHNLL